MATRGDELNRPLLVHGERLREVIDRVPTGGGEKFHPVTVDQARAQLAPQVSATLSMLRSIPDELRGPRLIFQATMHPNYLAASYFPSQLLDEADLVPLGSRLARGIHRTPTDVREETPTKSLLLSASETSLSRLTSIVEDEAEGRSARLAADQLREIAEVRPSSTDEILSAIPLQSRRADGLADWEAVLHPSTASRARALEPIDDETFEKWVRFVGRLGGEVNRRYRRSVGGLTFVPIRLGPEALEQAVLFNPLRALRPLPMMRPIPPGVLRATAHRLAPPSSATPVSPTRLAVFDGGIDPASTMYPTCAIVDASGEPSDSHAVSHGNAVTGAVLYGNLSPGQRLPAPAAAVEHFRVLPHPDPASDPEIYWVLDRIVEAVEQGDYDVVNLSLGPAISVEDNEEPNRWTSTLDQLAYEQDVLFVIAAGNNGEEDSITGLDRVQVPADMANGLTVGACNCIAPDEPWERTSYSAVGPGRSGARIQPTGVQFGGDDARLFLGLTADGTLVEAKGTSFAAPLVVHALARLGAQLGEPRTTVNNLRALSVHLAERHPDGADLTSELGHGRFLPHFDEGLLCASNEVLVLYEDTIDRDEVVSVPLTVPPGLKHGFVEIAWTISLTAAVEPTQPSEYTQTTLDVVFRPHDQKFRLSKGTRTRIVDVVEQAGRFAELYADGFTASTQPVSVSVPGSAGTEDERRDGGKWETLRHYRKRFRASSLRNPCLNLTYLAREGGLLSRGSPPMDFTIVVSIKAAEGIDLYQQVQAAFPVLTPIDISLRAQARS